LFHPLVGLRYETTSAQLHSFMAGVRSLLNEHANVDSISVRVRFVRLGISSLDVDIFAYVFAHDWNNFLEIQEELLFGIMDIIQKAGAEIAFPSQSLYLATDKSDKLTQAIRDHGEQKEADTPN
jgi:MscS family membrane protein